MDLFTLLAGRTALGGFQVWKRVPRKRKVFLAQINAKKTQKERKELYNILLSRGIFARHFMRQRIKRRKVNKVEA